MILQKNLVFRNAAIGIFLLVLLFFTAFILSDFIQNSRTKVSRPKSKSHTRGNELLYNVHHGKTIDAAEIAHIKTFVDHRYDTSDFRLQSVLRILYGHDESLTPATADSIKHMLLDFKYWMDEPGKDGMCFWSENHQILFAAAEYLAGQKYPNDIFTNNGMTGAQHKVKARQRILTWLQQRRLHGFIEWNSNVYYVEDIAPLANLIDFAEDEEIVRKSKIILDLMLYDLASQSYRGTFVSSMGRSYEGGKKSGKRASTRAITEKLFGWETDPGERRGMELNFLYCKNYDIPPVLREIGRDTSTVIIKSSTGLDISEMPALDLIGLEDRQIMMQWAMEAFSNPLVIENSLDYINAHNMQSNKFLYGFRSVNYRLLRWFGLLPVLSRILQPASQGTAIQRANVYTYKTPHYSMYTAQNYHPGEYGDQQHVFGLTLSNNLSVFHNHPALLPHEKPPFGNSPTYWVGYGRLPHSVQDKNINLSIYVLPKKKGFMEKRLLHYTQFYCPKEQFDRFILEKNKLYLQYDHAFLAVMGYQNFTYNEQQKAIMQQGRRTFFICEAGSDAQESFDQFVRRTRANETDFDGEHLRYRSNGSIYNLQFGGAFKINGAAIDTQYPRFDSPYIRAGRDSDTLRFQYKDHSLLLNFDKMMREMATRAARK